MRGINDWEGRDGDGERKEGECAGRKRSADNDLHACIANGVLVIIHAPGPDFGVGFIAV